MEYVVNIPYMEHLSKLDRILLNVIIVFVWITQAANHLCYTVVIPATYMYIYGEYI